MSIKLKLLRTQAGLTLEEVAQAAELTRSYVSKLERGVSTPSVGTALKLSKALGVPVEELFGEPSEQDPVTITRAAEARQVGDQPDAPRLVAGTAPGQRMLAFVLDPAQSSTRGRPMSHHNGEEVLYVLKGKVLLQLADRKIALEQGDCAHFTASVPHRITAQGEAAASVLLVVAGEP